MIEKVEITAPSVEIRKEKDAEGQDLFFITRRRSGEAGGYLIVGRDNQGTASSWDLVLEKISDLNLPSRLLNGAKRQLDQVGSAIINVSGVAGES